MDRRELGFWDRNDIPIVGFAIGLIIPIITYFVLYFVQYSHWDFMDFVYQSKMKNTAPILLRTMVFTNLPVFLVFNIFKKFMICKGIFSASILFIAPMLIIKYL
ncbi:MAG TPA: hypothetical protein VFD65_02905 [Chitinophagales bacterium]|nr:hypothetical protein [Chitinophagales bacterium]